MQKNSLGDLLRDDWNVTPEVAIEQLSQSIKQFQSLEPSQEGLLDVITGLFSETYNALRVSVNKLAGSREQLAVEFPENQLSKLNPSKFKNNYAYLISQEVQVPVGMTSQYLPYIKHSLTMVELFKRAEEGVGRLRSDIGRVVSTEGGIKDSTLFDELYYLTLSKDRKKVLEDWGKLRKGDDNTALREYGSVFRSNSEFFECVDLSRGISKLYNEINRKRLIADMEATMEYLQALLKRAKVEGFSRPLINKIGTGVYETALNVEAISTGIFNQNMINTSLGKVAEQIQQVAN